MTSYGSFVSVHGSYRQYLQLSSFFSYAMTDCTSTNKKRIAILAAFPLEWLDETGKTYSGRSQFWLLSMAEAFSLQTEYEIHWIVLKTRAAAQTITHRGQYFHILPSISHAFNAATFYLQARFAVRRILKRIKPSLVHAWGTEGYYGICGREFKGPKMLSIQGLLNACIARSPMGSYMVKQAKWERPTIKAYNLVTAESPWAMARVRDLVPDAPVVQWEYAVDESFRSVRRKPAESPEVLMVCGSGAHKNIPTALKAFASPQLAHVKLIIAGIPESAYPEAPPNVELLGAVPHSTIPQLMARAWCLLHPSMVDTGPTVAKEAKMVGLPLILSSQCGCQQYIEEGKSGFIVEPMDTQAIIDGVLAVTSSVECSLRMGMHKHEECCRALSQEKMISQLMSLYHRLISD